MSRHRSKVDWWVWVLSALALVVGVSYIALGLVVRRIPLWILGIYAASAALVISVSLPLYYDISEDRLTVRMGLVRWHIPLESIRWAAPSNAPWKAPAMSMDRLRIQYRQGGVESSILISPADKERFLDDLVSCSKHLRREGDQAVSLDGA